MIHLFDDESCRVSRTRQGFSLVEVTIAITLLASIAAIGFLSLSGYRRATENTKLENDVFALNQAAQVFRASGGNLADVTEPSALLARLKSVSGKEDSKYLVGFRGAMVDRRIKPVMMTPLEEKSDRPRAVWIPSQNRFAIVTAGAGIKEFALGEITSAAEVVRKSNVEYARASHWIWDFAEDGTSLRPEFNGTIADMVETPKAASSTGGAGMGQLRPPLVSLSGGFYASGFFPLKVTLTNPNPPGRSAIRYSLGGTPSVNYPGTSVVVVIPAESYTVTLVAFCQSLDPDHWLDSLSISEGYETFTFSGSSSGKFALPKKEVGGVHSITTTATGGSKFAWGTPAAGFVQPSSLTFEGAKFKDIVPEVEFVVGSLSFYNGSIYSGTGATGVELNVQLEVQVNIPVENEQLSFPLQLINTPNYSWQSEDANADYVKLTSTSSVFATASDGTIYYLVLGFATASGPGFTTIDEFHVWENHTAVGTLVARVTTVPPGSEDKIRPKVVLYTAKSEVNGQFEVQAKFDEFVNGFTVSDIVVGNGTITGFNGNGFDFSFFVNPSDDGSVMISIPEKVAFDLRNNGNFASNSVTVIADLTVPVGVFMFGASGSADGSSSNPFRFNGPVTVPLVFTESVTGLAISDFIIQNGSISNLTGSGSSYSFKLTGNAHGNVTVSIIGGGVVDRVGNPNAASEAVYFTYDAVAPNLQLAAASSTTSSTFVVTVTATEPILGFTASDVTVTNGSVQSLTGTGSNYSITVAPASIGNTSILVAANKVTDEAGNPNTASNTVVVAFELPQFINFNNYTIQSFDSSQDSGTFSIQSSGSELRIKDNGWKSINFPYTVKTNTVIAFEFSSPKQGEIHGLGFDNGNAINSNRIFKLYGDQNWGITTYHNYSGTGWKSYVIPVGQFYTGAFAKLVFAADDDNATNGLGESRFRNVRVYNQ